jgi:hypothetical protein
MARQEELRKKEPIVRSDIRILKLNRWAIFSRQILSVPGTSYFTRRKLEGQYVIATINTHQKRLAVKQGSKNKIIKSFSFPIRGRIIVPLLPITRRKS